MVVEKDGSTNDYLFKILVIGDLGTGKTSIIKRYVHNFFSHQYRATIGVDFALKVINYDADTVVRLQLWDIAGQERFSQMTRVYYKEAVGCVIVYDISRVATFDAVLKWKNDLDSKVQLKDGKPIPCILMANKCDLEPEGPSTTPSKLDDFCRENGFIDWFSTSAKEGTGIEKAAGVLVTKVIENENRLRSSSLNENQDTDRIRLNQLGGASTSKSNPNADRSKCC